MATIDKKTAKKTIIKPTETVKKQKLSKFGKAMRAGVLKGSIIEISDDPWNLADVKNTPF